jgi:hypothetical protein
MHKRRRYKTRDDREIYVFQKEKRSPKLQRMIDKHIRRYEQHLDKQFKSSKELNKNEK